jgi:hypothetical protein
MPKVDDLDQSSVFEYAVINPNRSVEEVAKARTPGYRRANVRERSQKFYVIEKRISKSFGCRAFILADELQSFVEVPQGVVREVDFVFHRASLLRTSSIGTRCPSSAL